MLRTTSTRARSLRALTTAAALITLSLTGTASLAGSPRHGSHTPKHQTGHSYQKCGQCDRWDDHRHDDGGVLWLGGRRYGLSDGACAVEDIAGELRRAGYRIHKSGNTLRISSHGRLGGIHFSSGTFGATITSIDRCTALICFEPISCAPVVVKPIVRPVYRPVVVKPTWTRPRYGHGGHGWRHRDRWNDDCRDSRTVISFRW